MKTRFLYLRRRFLPSPLCRFLLFFLPPFGVDEILYKLLAGYRLPSALLGCKINLASQSLTSFTLLVTKLRETEEYSPPSVPIRLIRCLAQAQCTFTAQAVFCLVFFGILFLSLCLIHSFVAGFSNLRISFPLSSKYLEISTGSESSKSCVATMTSSCSCCDSPSLL